MEVNNNTLSNSPSICLYKSTEIISNFVIFIQELNKIVIECNNNFKDVIFKKIYNYVENIKSSDKFQNQVIIDNTDIPLIDRATFFNTCVWVIRPMKDINDTIDIAYLEPRVEQVNNFVYKTIWKPVFGIIGDPHTNMIYWGSESLGSFQVNPDGTINAICKISQQPKDFTNIIEKRKIRVAMTKSVDYNVDQFINKYFQTNFEKNLCVNSIKMINVFLGKVDIYPCLEETNELEICAATAIGLSCGYNIKIYDKNYQLKDFDKLQNVTFNKENMNNPYFIIF